MLDVVLKFFNVLFRLNINEKNIASLEYYYISLYLVAGYSHIFLFNIFSPYMDDNVIIEIGLFGTKKTLFLKEGCLKKLFSYNKKKIRGRNYGNHFK